MLKKLLKVSIPLVLITLLFWNISKDWQTVVGYWENFRLAPLIFAFLFLLIDYPEGALGWHAILKKMGAGLRFGESLRIWIISSTTRYIPGSVWQYIGRVELANKAGVPRSQTIFSMSVEAFLALTAGIFVFLLIIPFVQLEQLNINFWLLLLLFPLVVFHPAVANKVIGMIAKISKKNIRRLDVNLGFRDTVSIFPLFVINFFINGIALYLLLLSLSQDLVISQILVLSGFYSLSWVFGYVALFAPAGVGVTEVSLAYLLSFSMPLSLASAIALSYRVFLTMAELLVFVFVLKSEKLRKYSNFGR